MYSLEQNYYFKQTTLYIEEQPLQSFASNLRPEWLVLILRTVLTLSNAYFFEIQQLFYFLLRNSMFKVNFKIRRQSSLNNK